MSVIQHRKSSSKEAIQIDSNSMSSEGHLQSRQAKQRRYGFQNFFTYKMLSLIVAMLVIFYWLKIGTSMMTFIQYYSPLHTRLQSQQSEENKCSELTYGIVIDAGSTGSRIHVYKFCVNDNASLRLLNETFDYLTPGLSHYSDDPRLAALSLKPLLETAVQDIPKHQQSCTPLIVRATAGLRLLEGNKADMILKAVYQYLRSEWPFYMMKEVHNSAASGGGSNSNAVGIMDGKDEALYAWMTVNFLMGKLNESASQLTVQGQATIGIMDLGGGSTQIVFQPNFHDPSLITSIEPQCSVPPLNIVKDPKQEDACGDYYEEKVISNREFVLYQYSYLGYGLMEARKQVNKIVIDTPSLQVKDKSLVKKYTASLGTKSDGVDLQAVFINPCMPESYTEIVKQSQNQKSSILMVGAKSDQKSYEQCSDIIRRLFDKKTCTYQPASCSFNGIFQPHLQQSFTDLDGAELYAFSYFYDKTRMILHLDSDKDSHAEWTVRDVQQLAHVICNPKSVSTIGISDHLWSHFGGRDEFISHAMSLMTASQKKTQNSKLGKYMPELCLDLTYIFHLLHTGYGLDPRQKLIIRKKINGIETGWSLGAALELVQNHIQQGLQCQH
ncbi:hypothetical protein MIR68_003344 [Amoeboaphelidium protococcarum]|nr:hypothetical protein MIR68_003344 [Amoeboaphelidium protococcarum]